MAAAKDSTGVYIEVQRGGGGFLGVIRVLNTGALIRLCGHESDPHPIPGKAVQCAESIARRKGWSIYDR